jgi:hypothetical protein
MERTSGRADIVIGLLDGPVATNHPDLAAATICEVSGTRSSTCTQASSAACVHGTLVAGVLCARRGSAAPALCPTCTLLVRLIFAETTPANGQMPSTTPAALAAAIVETVDAGARVLNVSAALAPPSTQGERKLGEALDYAARHGVIAVVAAGNQGTLGSSAITRHPWVIPVVACDLQGRPLRQSNVGSSIGRRGLSAPGEDITSLGTEGQPRTFGGTSAATPFVTGTIALVWSAFPAATAAEVQLAVTRADAQRRDASLLPVLQPSAGIPAPYQCPCFSSRRNVMACGWYRWSHPVILVIRTGRIIALRRLQAVPSCMARYTTTLRDFNGVETAENVNLRRRGEAHGAHTDTITTPWDSLRQGRGCRAARAVVCAHVPSVLTPMPGSPIRARQSARPR